MVINLFLFLNIIELFINLWCYSNGSCHCWNYNYCDERENKKSSKYLACRTNEKNTERITVKHQEQSVTVSIKEAVVVTYGNNFIIRNIERVSHRKRSRWAFAFSNA